MDNEEKLFRLMELGIYVEVERIKTFAQTHNLPHEKILKIKKDFEAIKQNLNMTINSIAKSKQDDDYIFPFKW